MSIRDFVKKHKKKLVAASGILASLLAMTHLAGKINPLNLPAELGYVVDPSYDPNYYPAEPIVRPRRHSEPTWIPAPYRERRYSEEEYKRPRARDGRGKKNSLLKAVQAYKKKHGCSLKEAWAAVRQ
jgi:hypothetical protein